MHALWYYNFEKRISVPAGVVCCMYNKIKSVGVEQDFAHLNTY